MVAVHIFKAVPVGRAVETEKPVSPEDGQEPCRCPSCKADLGVADDYYGIMKYKTAYQMPELVTKKEKVS